MANPSTVLDELAPSLSAMPAPTTGTESPTKSAMSRSAVMWSRFSGALVSSTMPVVPLNTAPDPAPISAPPTKKSARFGMVSRTETSVAYDAGSFLLKVNADLNPGPPIPSFPVKDIRAAKEGLIANGCTILLDNGDSLCFRDPFGIVYCVAEEKTGN